MSILNYNQIDHEGYRLGVLGSSLAHSKSPQIQNAGLRYLRLSGTYEPYEISTENFDRDISKLLVNIDGLNITFPYKESILKYLNACDPLVEKIKACNTIAVNNGRITGYNTDYYGFKESLKPHKLKGNKACILGAGGAAKAIITALEDMDLEIIEIYARNPNKASLKLPKQSRSKIQIKLYDDNVSFHDAGLIINCTPVGQGRLDSGMPLSKTQIKELNNHCLIYDLVYTQTLLLKAAQERGLTTIDGSEMLILQAAKSLSIWTNTEVTEELVSTMRAAFHTKN